MACELFVDVGEQHLRAEDGGDLDGGKAEASVTMDSAPADANGIDSGVTVLASGQQRPSAILVDSNYVYWVNEAEGAMPGAIMRMPKSGGTPQPLAPGRANPKSLSVAIGTVFFTDDLGGAEGQAGVFRAAKSDGHVAPVDIDGLGAGALSLNAGFLYSEAWAPGAPGRVRKSSVDGEGGTGGCYPYVTTSPDARIRAIDADGEYLYFVDTKANAILRSALGCNSTATVFAPDQGGARALALASVTNVFWITATSVWRQARSQPGLAPLVLTDRRTSLAGLAVATAGVVVTDEGAGSVVFVSQSHSSLIASGQNQPHGIASDTDGALYWTNRGSGEIVRSRLPN
jgi:hypothetical protein